MIWHSDNIPNALEKRLIVPLFKKGENRECKNYRGVSLQSAVGKAFMKVIQQRLQQKGEQVAREEHAGFRPERGCCDQIFVLRQLLEERIRCGKKLVIVFIDFAAAFDCVHRPALWKSLVAEGVPAKIIHLLQQVYERTTSCVRVTRRSSEDFPVHTDVRQDCVSLSIVFNTVVDAIMRKVFTDRRGVQFGDNDYITDLMFADDSVIFTDTEAKASAIIHDIKNAAYSYDLTIDADKTKVFTSDGSRAIINLDNVQLEQVQHFKYLGSIVEEQKVATMADITNRIDQATAAFGALTWCF